MSNSSVAEPGEICSPRRSSSTPRAFRSRHRFGDRRLRIPLHWRLELGRLPSERFHDFGRHGPGRSASLDPGEAFRLLLRFIFGTGFHRHRIAHDRAIRAPAAAPLSRRREVKMPQLLTY